MLFRNSMEEEPPGRTGIAHRLDPVGCNEWIKLPRVHSAAPPLLSPVGLWPCLVLVGKSHAGEPKMKKVQAARSVLCLHLRSIIIIPQSGLNVNGAPCCAICSPFLQYPPYLLRQFLSAPFGCNHYAMDLGIDIQHTFSFPFLI